MLSLIRNKESVVGDKTVNKGVRNAMKRRWRLRNLKGAVVLLALAISFLSVLSNETVALRVVESEHSHPDYDGTEIIVTKSDNENDITDSNNKNLTVNDSFTPTSRFLEPEINETPFEEGLPSEEGRVKAKVIGGFTNDTVQKIEKKQQQDTDGPQNTPINQLEGSQNDNTQTPTNSQDRSTSNTRSRVTTTGVNDETRDTRVGTPSQNSNNGGQSRQQTQNRAPPQSRPQPQEGDSRQQPQQEPPAISILPIDETQQQNKQPQDSSTQRTSQKNQKLPQTDNELSKQQQDNTNNQDTSEGTQISSPQQESESNQSPSPTQKSSTKVNNNSSKNFSISKGPIIAAATCSVGLIATGVGFYFLRLRGGLVKPSAEFKRRLKGGENLPWRDDVYIDPTTGEAFPPPDSMGTKNSGISAQPGYATFESVDTFTNDYARDSVAYPSYGKPAYVAQHPQNQQQQTSQQYYPPPGFVLPQQPWGSDGPAQAAMNPAASIQTGNFPQYRPINGPPPLDSQGIHPSQERFHHENSDATTNSLSSHRERRN